MANNYLQFSETIDNLTPEERVWATERLKEMMSKWEDDPDTGWYFEWRIEDLPKPHLWLFSGESAEPEHVAAFVQEFLKKFRPEECFSLTWAATCSKMRVGEFDGGAVFVTAEYVHWMVAYDFVEKETKKFKASKKEKKS